MPGDGMYSQIEAAREWGRRPSEFGLCKPEDDLAVMIAYLRAKSKMQAKDNEEQEKELKWQHARNKAKRK